MVAEKNSVWRSREQADDAFHIGNEAHVEHPVGSSMTRS